MTATFTKREKQRAPSSDYAPWGLPCYVCKQRVKPFAGRYTAKGLHRHPGCIPKAS